MFQKTTTIILTVVCLALGANIYRLHKQHKEQLDQMGENPHEIKLKQLEAEKTSWSQRENDLLRQNGELTVQLNDLKMQLEKKPQTIYIKKNENNNTIDRNASDEFTRILTGRYGVATGE